MIEIFAVQPKFVTIVAHDRVIRVPAIIENKWWINLSLFVFITIVLFQKLFYFTIRYRLDLLYIGIIVFDPLVNWVNIIFVEHIKLVHLFLSLLIGIILTYEKNLSFPNTFLDFFRIKISWDSFGLFPTLALFFPILFSPRAKE